ncbi:GDSL-type esterase/lipase family protein [Pseudoduganella plicata]|uniref:GDSL-type esterase/lipase family protein n=1 Tax=Pseudoduganella plicata TaxID=321984 RepID=UPI00141B388E|nr:GDSL-type esterase/lipase family protein [Pseudoduganella plicata]
MLAATTLQLANAAPATECTNLPAQEASDAAFTWTTGPEAQAAPAAAAYKIAIWGDSLTSARNFIDAALKTGGIGKTTPSFIQAGIKVPGLNLPLKHSCATGGWKTAYAYKEKGGTPGFSEGMLSMESSTPGDVIHMDFRYLQPDSRVTQLDIQYDKPAPDSSLLLGVAVDGGAEQLIPLSRTDAGTLRIMPEVPMATIAMRLVSGQIKVHGFRPRYRNAPNVVLDTFSVPGAQLRGWNYVDARLTQAAPAYDLILIQYGTNEGASPSFNAAAYADSLRASLARLRRFQPHARCILIGPPDRGVVGSGAGGPMKYAEIHHRIALAQQRAAVASRCGFWDWQGETGGPGTAVRWTRTNPPLMQPDLTHMTARGYEVSGRLFARSFPFKIPQR